MNPNDFGRVGVLAGGSSNEREISLESGEAVFRALKERGADAVFLDIKNKDSVKQDMQAAAIDIAFIALHGAFGEDGTIQTMLEELDIPYTGSGPRASGLALDKIASKEIFIKNGIDTPRYTAADKTCDYSDLKRIIEIIKLPLVVKPQFEGSSIGVSIVEEMAGIKKALSAAFAYGDKIVIEEYINGRELTVGILKERPLPVVEVVAHERFYNFSAKYKRADTEYIVPAKIRLGEYKKAQDLALLAHNSLGCRAFSRVDMMLDEKQNRIYALEVNSIPGLTSHSLLPKAAIAAGIEFGQLCLKIIEASLKKEKVFRNG